MSLQETAAEGESLWQRDEMSCDGMRGCCEGYVITQVGLSGLYSRRRPCIGMMSYVLLKCQAAATAHGRVGFGRSSVQRSRSLTEALHNQSVVCVFVWFFSVSLQPHVELFRHILPHSYLFIFIKTQHKTQRLHHLSFMMAQKKHFTVNYTSASLQQCGAAAPPSRIFLCLNLSLHFPQTLPPPPGSPR